MRGGAELGKLKSTLLSEVYRSIKGIMTEKKTGPRSRQFYHHIMCNRYKTVIMYYGLLTAQNNLPLAVNAKGEASCLTFMLVV